MNQIDNINTSFKLLIESLDTPETFARYAAGLLKEITKQSLKLLTIIIQKIPSRWKCDFFQRNWLPPMTKILSMQLTITLTIIKKLIQNIAFFPTRIKEDNRNNLDGVKRKYPTYNI